MHTLVLLASLVALTLQSSFAHKCIHDKIEKPQFTTLTHYTNHPFHVIQNVGAETYFRLEQRFASEGMTSNWPTALGLKYEIGAPENPEKDELDAAIAAAGGKPSNEYFASPVHNPAAEGEHKLSSVELKKGIDYYPVLSKTDKSIRVEQESKVNALANDYFSDQHERFKLETSNATQSWKKLRINFVTDKLSSQAVKDLLPELAETLSDLLYVYPVTGALKLERHCTQHWLKAGEPYVPNRCVSYSDLQCGSDYGAVPSSFYKSQSIYSSISPLLIVGYTAGGAGISDTDVVIFVTDSTSQCSEGVVAYAAGCNFDQYGRPIAGFVNVCMPTYPGLKMTLLHEIFHALGFTGSQYPNYRTPDGFKASDAVITTYERDNDVFRFTLEPAITIARQHFNCYTVPGVELENQGGTGTVGSHVERRVYHGDFMIGEVVPNTVISPISASILESSSWYRVDYSKTSRLAWGDKAGCDFAFQSKCINGEGAIHREFCHTPEEQSCTADFKGKGKCMVYEYSDAIPSQFQYFVNPKYGGGTLIDYCPYYEPQTYCSDAVATTRDETFSNTSRCFMNTLSSGGSAGAVAPSCYNIECNYDEDGVSSINVFMGNETFTCEREDAGTSKTVGGWSGAVYCPPNYDALCETKPMPDYVVDQTGCKFRCLHGECEEGVCICEAGFKGDFCEISAAFQATVSFFGLLLCSIFYLFMTMN